MIKCASQSKFDGARQITKVCTHYVREVAEGPEDPFLHLCAHVPFSYPFLIYLCPSTLLDL
jgi:hypothetical protein